MKTTKFLTFAAALTLIPLASPAVETDPVGFVNVTVPANSDAILAVPLNRAPEFKGVIQTIAGNVITVAGTPGWTANQFGPGVTANKTYAVQIASGSKEGLIGKITANGTGTVTVTLDAGEDLSNIGSVDVPVDPDGAGPLTAQADQIDIFPYWTLSTIISPTTSGLSGSQIQIPNSSAAGTNVANSGIFETDGSGWFDGDFNSADHTTLSFGQAFILRTGGSAVTISMVGAVPMTKFRLRVKTITANMDQDLAIGYMCPIPESLNSLNLGFSDEDQLLVFDNTTSGVNKSPSAIYIYSTADGWLDGDFNPIPSTVKLQPGFGYIFRKKGTASPATFVWSNLQSYLQ